MFQRDGPTLHLAYDHIIQLYRNILYYFCKRECVDRADLMAFDPSLSSNHVPLNHIYLGAAIHGLLQTETYNRNQGMVDYVRTRCREFMVIMCQQIKKRFDMNTKL